MGAKPSFEFSEIKGKKVSIVHVKCSHYVWEVIQYEDDPNDGYWTLGYVEFQHGKTLYRAYTMKDYRDLANKTFVVKTLQRIRRFWYYCPTHVLSLESEEGDTHEIRLCYAHGSSTFLTKLQKHTLQELGVNEKTGFE